MKYRMRRVLLLVLPLALVAELSSAQEPAGRVKVQFPLAESLGVSGPSVEGLILRLTRLGTDEPVEVGTDADGSFAFERLEPGGYRLHLAPPAGKPPAGTISVAISGASPEGARGRKVREIVVVGLAAHAPPGERRIPAHTPEWTDLSDQDPGVAQGDDRHDDWIELVSARMTRGDGGLVLTIPPAAWETAGRSAYFDLRVRPDRPATTTAVRGVVVFGDGIRGRRPARAKPDPPSRRW